MIGKWFGKDVAKKLADEVIPDAARAAEKPTRQTGENAESAALALTGQDLEGRDQIGQSGFGESSQDTLAPLNPSPRSSAEFSPGTEAASPARREIPDRHLFRGPVAAARFYLREMGVVDPDSLIHDMMNKGADLSDTNVLDHWAEKNKRPRREVTETNARSAGEMRDATGPPSQSTGDLPQVTRVPVRDETPPPVTEGESPARREIPDRHLFRGPVAAARFYLREMGVVDPDSLIHDMMNKGADLSDANVLDHWAEKNKRPRG